MDTMDKRRLTLAICDTLRKSVIPANIAIEDLRLATLDPDSEEHFDDILDVWADLCAGRRRVTDTYATTRKVRHPGEDHLNPRQHLALRLAKTQGQVTNQDIRICFDVSPETIRMDLAALVENGLLEAVGKRRARVYRLP
jgi:DNA-binding transcriptional ArsR family regulator